MKKKLILKVALMAVVTVIAIVVCMFYKAEQIAVDTAMETAVMEGSRYTGIRDRDLTEEESQFRLETYFMEEAERHVENAAVDSLETSPLISVSNNIRDVATVVAFVIIMFCIVVLWIRDTLIKMRENSWKHRY